jgi:quercetin dioxygenase-like cupin family protein
MNPAQPQPTDVVRPANASRAAIVQAPWGSLQWLASADIGNAAGLTLGRVVIRRGQSNPRHSHPGAEEVLYLLSGRLRHTLGPQSFELSSGDTITIPAGVFHNASSIGDTDADMIVAYSSAHRDFVLEDPGADARGER